MISEEDRERLASAVRDAEAGTAGEIIVVIAHQASGYRSVPVLWGLLAAMVVPWPLIWLTTLSASRIYLLQILVVDRHHFLPFAAKAPLCARAGLHQARPRPRNRPIANSWRAASPERATARES